MRPLSAARGADAVSVRAGDVEIAAYVFQPDTDQYESPHPYLHPVRTPAGELVSLFRPHDHPWHKGISLALPNVGPDNFWGGPTYVRDEGYVRLPNNGTQRHDELTVDETPEAIGLAESLTWISQDGEERMTERRQLDFALLDGESGWRLGFATALTNTTGTELRFGSPTTEGRDNAGYGGLFWRGPRSFNGGSIRAEDGRTGPDLMGQRSRWLSYTGKQDGNSAAATLVFVDSPANDRQPVRWFVRSEPYACISPAPFFSDAVILPAGHTLRLSYAVLIGDGDWDAARIAALVDQAGQP